MTDIDDDDNDCDSSSTASSCSAAPTEDDPTQPHPSRYPNASPSNQSSRRFQAILKSPTPDTASHSPFVLLPATTYNPNPPPLARPYQAPSSFTGPDGARHPPGSNFRAGSPSNFYRPYGNHFNPITADSSPLESLLPHEIDHLSNASSTTPTATINSPKLRREASAPLDIHLYRPRTTSNPPPVRYLAATPTRSQADVTSKVRNRQSSVKDPVNHLNRTVDELLPRPPATTSTYPDFRRPSRSGSPALATSAQPSRRPRPGLYSSDTTPSHFHPHRIQRSPSPPFALPQILPTAPSPSTSPASSPAWPSPDFSTTSRRPLFGELLSIDTAIGQPGHGIPTRRRRRGSESSVPSPNPFFLVDSRRDLSSAIPPPSPTAWYLGYTSLDSVNPNQPLRPQHRRSRSDLTGVNKPPVTGALGTHMAAVAPEVGTVVQREQRLSTTNPFSSHMKSRIPVSSSRRPSYTAESASSSSRSSRSDSRVCSPSLPPKGASRLPIPSLKAPSPGISPPSSRRPSASVTSPANRRDGLQEGRTPRKTPLPSNSTLKAYIASPPPMTSPPLRSSRPRQSVSHATSTSSKPSTKVGGRLSQFEDPTGNDWDGRGRRKPPELSNVDFAARRQKIQQAINKSIQQTEAAAVVRRRASRYQRAEEVRSRLLREGERRKLASALAAHHTDSGQRLDDAVSTEAAIPTPLTPDDDQAFQVASTVPSLTIDTASPIERTMNHEPSHRTVVDSPTLGGPVGVIHDQEPLSAVTTGTNDSDVTRFENEPQAGLRQPDLSHRTVLSQIMRMRDESSESGASEDGEVQSSESEEKGSIQIMLAPSPYFADSLHDSDGDEEVVVDNSLKRWSLASWNSSMREHPSSDARSDRVAESDRGQEGQTDQHDPAETAVELCAPTEPVVPVSQLDPVLSPPPPPKSRYRNSTVSQPDSITSINPSLIRKGGWDSKRVTQLYLDELTRGAAWRSSRPPEQLSWDSGLLDNESSSRPNSFTDDAVLVAPGGEDLHSVDSVTHRASLSLRDDWESASPSIADWMQVAAGEGSQRSPPPSPPPPPPKADTLNASNAPGPASSQHESTGSLAIHLEPPTEIHPPLPVPSRPPPSLPGGEKGLVNGHARPPVPLSDITSPPPPSTNLPTRRFPSVDEFTLARSSEESFFPLGGISSSAQTLASSATSQPPITGDQHSAEFQPEPTADQRRLKKRQHVIKELIDTEYSYGQDMKVVDDIYKGTSSSCLDLTAEDVRVLFGNSDQVVQFSMNFQDGLKKAAKSVYVMPKSQRWSSKRSSQKDREEIPLEDRDPGMDATDPDRDNQTFLGHIFMENMAQMEKVYSDYLRNHEAASKKLQALQKNPKVAIWLKECREWASDLTTAWNLDSLLVKPVQRILKYPLLLGELGDCTPDGHPDKQAIMDATDGVRNISARINELKKRADLVGAVVAQRKRKESDVRTGLSKAFGRRTEKLKQQVGLLDMFEDKEYDTLSQRFGDSFCQLQVVMRDVEMYTREVKTGMGHLNEFVLAIEATIDVAQSNYLELESKWRRFRQSVRDVMNVALPEHIASVRKSVIDPMIKLLKLYDGPQKVMHKRNKRLIDYARYKAIQDRGDKPDKKTVEQGEQFRVLNEALKDELPQLFRLTAKLMETCLDNFVEIQIYWLAVLQKKLGFLLDRFPADITRIADDWAADFSYAEAQVSSLALCNGSILSTVTTTDDRRPSDQSRSSIRAPSLGTDTSPSLSFDMGANGGYMQSPPLPSQSQTSLPPVQPFVTTQGRSHSGSSAVRTVNIQNSTVSAGSPPRPDTGSGTQSIPRLSLDLPNMNGALMGDHGEVTASPGTRYSGFFSSAMPMSDSPRPSMSYDELPPKDPKVLFLVASLYEFNIDRARREAGYPYLTYVAGEIFDVIAEKGELWLARNQDDPTNQVGWIWTKHFAKLPN